jgi:hypothetical protein
LFGNKLPISLGIPKDTVNSDGTISYNTNAIGDDPLEMGDNLIAIALPAGKTVVQLRVVTHVVVIFDDHTMTAWGRHSGSFNLGNMRTAHLGNRLSDMGDNLHLINLGAANRPVQIMLNWRATVVLFDNGNVVAFGSNEYGSLGTGTSSVSNSGYYIGDVASDFGGGMRLVDFGIGVKVRALTSNSFLHFCVLTHTNEVKCWGENSAGQLGLGDIDTRGDGMLLLDDGAKIYGQAEMGDNLPVVDMGLALSPCAGGGKQPECKCVAGYVTIAK